MLFCAKVNRVRCYCVCWIKLDKWLGIKMVPFQFFWVILEQKKMVRANNSMQEGKEKAQ